MLGWSWGWWIWFKLLGGWGLWRGSNVPLQLSTALFPQPLLLLPDLLDGQLVVLDAVGEEGAFGAFGAALSGVSGVLAKVFVAELRVDFRPADVAHQGPAAAGHLVAALGFVKGRLAAVAFSQSSLCHLFLAGIVERRGVGLALCSFLQSEVLLTKGN